MAEGRAAVRTHVLAGTVVVGLGPAGAAVPETDFDLLLTEDPDPPRPWVAASLGEVEAAVLSSPGAAGVLVEVLRVTELLPVAMGLAVESMAYSMLQHGDAFRRWLRERPEPRSKTAGADPVSVERIGERLDVVLGRPEVHNALDARMRDALVEAFELVTLDQSICEVHVRGAGPSFCSGGDLSEFGTTRDAAEAHRIRTSRSVGRALYSCADRVTAHVHGACVGAGVEISAFAHRVEAAPGTTFRLPEVAMGLVPGAGGTVSVPRRIGRHRCAYLALTGASLDAATALSWGLVDALADQAGAAPTGGSRRPG